MPANTNSGEDGHDRGPQPDAAPEVHTEARCDTRSQAQAEAPVTTRERSTSRFTRFGLPVLVGATVVAVAAGVLVAVGHPGHSDSPPVLRLIDQSRVLAATAEGRPGDTAVRVDRSRFVVSGALPTGPDRARVHTFDSGQAPRDQVTALAHALGLPGQPEREAAGWRFGADPSRTGVLVLGVSDEPGWPWQVATAVMAVPDMAVSVVPPAPAEVPPTSATTLPAPVQAPSTVSCLAIVNGRRLCPPPLLPESGAAVPGESIPENPDGTSSTEAPAAPGPDAGSASAPASAPGVWSTPDAGGTDIPQKPAPLPPTPAPDAIRKVSAPVLAALGLTDATVTVTTMPGTGTVVADPVVDGLPTSGYATMLHFDGATRLDFASGWLATPRQGARYPLTTAGDTLRDMPTPVPAMMCEPCPPPAEPATVTGAELGLVLRHDDRARPLLVPAWFYRLGGSDQPLVLIAVEPRFLGAPRDTSGASTGPAGAPADSGSSSSGSVSGSAGSGSAGQPGAPVQVAPPAPPASEAGSVEPAEPAPGASR